MSVPPEAITFGLRIAAATTATAGDKSAEWAYNKLRDRLSEPAIDRIEKQFEETLYEQLVAVNDSRESKELDTLLHNWETVIEHVESADLLVSDTTTATNRIVAAFGNTVPINEMLKIVDDHGPDDPILISPNSPRVISPSESSACIFPGHLFKDGSVGLVSTSGTLMLKLARNLSQRDIGQSTAIGIGGDPIVGTSMRTAVEWLDQDPDTEAILLSGEIGGRDEQKAAEYVARHATTPVVSYIVGTTAPERQQMGHAGAIISDDEETAEAKIEAFKQAGITFGSSPIDAVEKAVALLSS